MQEFGFELRLAAHLETERDWLVGRQVGTHVHGRRVMDLVCLEPGPEFESRASLTSEEIPVRAIESDAGPGRARYWKDAFDCHPDRAREVIERAVACGFFERERQNGRTYVRQTARYPDWVDSIVAIENKPDLGRPGALETQLLTDVELALADEVVLATASHVTGAHSNRIPEPVGIWQFDPETGERTVVREPRPLPVGEPGVEILDRRSSRTEIRIATAAEKNSTRRRVAERVYGKGWRTYDFPACSNVQVEDGGLPYCSFHERLVRPSTECSSDCPGHDPGTSPEIERERLRAERTPWEPDPEGRARRQAGLDQFER